MPLGYNVLDDHNDVFVIPELTTTDRKLFLGISATGTDARGRTQWVYTFAYGIYEADVQLAGSELYGPPEGGTERAVEAVLGFYSAYADGNLEYVPDDYGDLEARLTSQGEVVATGETAEFIQANGDRFGLLADDLEHGVRAWSGYLAGDGYRTAYETGKEPE